MAEYLPELQGWVHVTRGLFH